MGTAKRPSTFARMKPESHRRAGEKGKRIMEAQRTRPSIGRWYILFLISLMYLITYLDRVNISTVAPVISKEFSFDKVTMGIIFSAFVWAYALFQVPGGWLNDRFGPRRVLAIIVAYWSVMTAATAAATVERLFALLVLGTAGGNCCGSR